MKRTASFAALTLLCLAGCNRDNTTSPTLSERTDRFKDNMRETFNPHPSEHITLEDPWNDTYQPSGAGTTTYRSNTTYRRDTTRDYRTTDAPTRP